jgi:hypothetical protein
MICSLYQFELQYVLLVISIYELFFFNCPILSVSWREVVRWLGIPIALAEGGYAHFSLLKGLILGRLETRERVGVIWVTAVYVIWIIRNDIIFKHVGFNWEKVVEETKVLSWKILKSRSKGF